MSESPSPPPQRELRYAVPTSHTNSSHKDPHRDLHQDHGKHKIRVVPYSPPRISSEGSALSSSRPVSYVDSSPLGTPPVQTPTQSRLDESGQGARWDGGGGDTQSSQIRPGVSGFMHSPSTLAPQATLPVPSSPTDSDGFEATSRPCSPRDPSFRRTKRAISINSDKTFSLVPHSESSLSSRVGSFGSPPLSSTTPSGSWGRVSSSVFLLEDRSSSPVTPHASRRFSGSSTPPASTLPGSGPIPASSWGQGTMAGGMRKVERTPDAKGKELVYTRTPDSSDEALPAFPSLPEDSYNRESYSSPQLSSKGSFQTSESATLSERTNYKIYGESSPVAATTHREIALDVDDSLPPSSSHSNYQVLAESSSSNQSISDRQRPATNDSDANYVVFGNPSASSSSLASTGTRSPLRPEYSRESLVVAPLRPVRRSSFGRSGVFKSRSRESLRRGSLTSLGAALTQEATRSLFASSTVIHAQPSSHRRQSSWDSSPASSAASTPDMMVPHPHHWSAPLSTVMSESEGGSAPPSRPLSQFSGTDRRSSGLQSIHSRNFLSMSSSLAGLDENIASPSPPSQGASPELPPPTFKAGPGRDHSPNLLPIRDYDEDGDGLADLGHLHHRSSRTRLATSTSNGSLDRARSSASTRSLNPFAIPAWARLYYGSGEKRFVLPQASSESMRSLYNGPMYNDTSYGDFLNRKPSVERFVSSIRNPRRRPRDMPPAVEPEVEPIGSATPDATRPPTAPRTPQPVHVREVTRYMKKQTSSIWSPHLRRDRRSGGYSIWDPQSAVWSTQSGFDWQRNRQVILFAIGFIIPFAWMIAAFLPLPPKPKFEMAEQEDLQHDPYQLPITIDKIMYNSARWWRNLNRGMSIIGLLIIGAVIALAVVGAKQQWGS